ncbi:MAG: site-2 protease family protein [Chloroherpetonaceae bacterium]|nr:site-2 protease family protein [Chloroherpetonaceae bacterium]MCS7211669.1 site-2 protease family protein [Chloroherpetonaceae bacterium]MDW8018549.1 site-2 protease family protein [Chloroherpetonaceae bacterium]MDW8467353.1 site-2 protease family protein [Chloroherpetonaceae bacterium]
MSDNLFNSRLLFNAEGSPVSLRSRNLTFRQRVGEQKYWLHLLLFVTTFATTTLAGAQWVGKNIDLTNFEIIRKNFAFGLPFSVSFLLFLTCHEFGHFFAAMYHSVRASLPYYIPMPPIPILLNIGTFGALIRTRERIPDSTSLFDIGVYGPICGFVIALGVLIYGFATLPPIEYIYQIHPEYQALGYIPEIKGALFTGKNLLYWLLEKAFASPNIPPMTEMYHYPFLFAGWLGCFVTALNLLPIGQLDGGHIIYAMFGRRKHQIIARAFLILIVGLGIPTFAEWAVAVLSVFANFEFEGFGFPKWVYEVSWGSWIIWAIILARFVKIDHPPVYDEHPLDTKRMVIGWISIIIFVLCFTPVPFSQLP